MAESIGGGLAGIDTNLLVALDAILREGSISRAAHALSMSQPALSHKLGRLRILLDDPLMVRKGRGLVPTPRARRLAAPLAAALEQLEHVLVPEDFDPATASGVVRLASQYATVSFLPDLVDRLTRTAPGLDLHALQLGSEEPQRRLAEGLSDIVVQPRGGQITSLSRGQTFKLSESLFSQRLYPDPWVVIVREGHALCDTPLTPEVFASTPHILVSMRGDAYGFVDRALDGLGLERRIALLVQSFELGALEVSRSDWLMTTNLSIALAMQEIVGLRILPAPVELPSASVNQVWHARTHKDPAHVWLRKQIFECGQEIEARVLTRAGELGLG